MTQALTALSALSQETRLRAFRLLVQAGPEGMPAGEIAARLALPPPTASFHLAQLATAGLLSSRPVGRYVIYSVDFECMAALLDYLTEDCCGGRACLPAASGRHSR